jgi:hypothetical protein
MTRIRTTTLSLTTLAVAAALALSACGAGPEAASPPAQAAAGLAELGDPGDLGDEAYALTAVGLATGLEADPAPSASAPAQGRKHRPGIRKYLRKNTLHGEITVQRADGVRTVVVQRGTVTAAGATSVTVKSTDGVTWTWAFDEALRVVQDRKAVAASTLKTGAEVGLAGRKDGTQNVARLIVIK